MMRAVLCPALAVVCFLGVSWRSSQRVSGQESDSQVLRVYRPGLRNSFADHPLNAEELNLVLTALRHKTGFTQMRFDDAGFLTIDDRSQFIGGSATARKLLLAAIDGKKSINLQSHNNSPKVAFARVGVGTIRTGWRSIEKIEVEPIEIDFLDFKYLRGDPKAVEAFDLGYLILHELCHTTLELSDLVDEDLAGDCEKHVNSVRRELGMPVRKQYHATPLRVTTSSTGGTVLVAELAFAKVGPQGRTKSKRLYVRWNVLQVGKVEKTQTRVAAT